jgi:hypothetical protein
VWVSTFCSYHLSLSKRVISSVPLSIETALEMKHKIDNALTHILAKTMQDDATSDTDSKTDLVRLLLRARKAEMVQDLGATKDYHIDEDEMKQHMMGLLPLTFLLDKVGTEITVSCPS